MPTPAPHADHRDMRGGRGVRTRNRSAWCGALCRQVAASGALPPFSLSEGRGRVRGARVRSVRGDDADALDLWSHGVLGGSVSPRDSPPSSWPDPRGSSPRNEAPEPAGKDLPEAPAKPGWEGGHDVRPFRGKRTLGSDAERHDGLGLPFAVAAA